MWASTSHRRDQLANFSGTEEYGNGTPVAGTASYLGRTLAQVSGFGEFQVPMIPVSVLPGWIKGVNLDIAARW